MTKTEKKSFHQSLAEWKLFLYNPATGQFLGRTASSWGLILLFYLVFYVFLAALFTLTMWAMLQTLSDEVPKYQDRIPSPGVSIFPRSPTPLEYTFNASNRETYKGLIDDIINGLKPYSDEAQMNLSACHGQNSFFEQTGPTYMACQFPLSLLDSCGSEGVHSDFGYSKGKPCFYLKMNRIIGLKPEGRPKIHCSVKDKYVNEAEALSFPDQGKIDIKYFPYYGKKRQPNYLQPLVAIQLRFNNSYTSAEAIVDCSIQDSPNLKNNDERDKFLGRLSFRVQMFDNKR
ncbi:sodium/potassium-transporting ATPase subunit beta-3 [Sorex araneus]|uniref:sodium/potassium-transporting ATPase subunit beta-3 n=1 Tax=Sorex araneus TaxID=42254 RepID=UPI002433DDAC|nr:sodium/potassium-transporting ATPase subunit beta-3 [Sorex araneus]